MEFKEDQVDYLLSERGKELDAEAVRKTQHETAISTLMTMFGGLVAMYYWSATNLFERCDSLLEKGVLATTSVIIVASMVFCMRQIHDFYISNTIYPAPETPILWDRYLADLNQFQNAKIEFLESDGAGPSMAVSLLKYKNDRLISLSKIITGSREVNDRRQDARHWTVRVLFWNLLLVVFMAIVEVGNQFLF
jgi:hypothetical protein